MKHGALFFIAALAALSATVADAMTYKIDRDIGDGSVVGFIETDGTLGTLAAANILDWSITLTSPDLGGGSPQLITGATGVVGVFGSGLSANSTDIVFDFGVAGAGFIIADHGSSPGGWCMSSTGLDCLVAPLSPEPIDVSEGIYFNTSFSGPAEIEERSGRLIVASAVPLPASLPLLVAAIGGLAFARRTHPGGRVPAARATGEAQEICGVVASPLRNKPGQGRSGPV